MLKHTRQKTEGNQHQRCDDAVLYKLFLRETLISEILDNVVHNPIVLLNPCISENVPSVTLPLAVLCLTVHLLSPDLPFLDETEEPRTTTYDPRTGLKPERLAVHHPVDDIQLHSIEVNHRATLLSPSAGAK